MKKTVLFLLVFMAVVLILPGFTSEEGFSVEVGGGYAVATDPSSAAGVAERLGVTEDEIKALFADDVKFIAVSKDKKTQIRISCFEDDFSKRAYDSAEMSDDQTAQMISLYSSSYKEVSVVKNGDRKFAKTISVLKDSGGVYTATQYVTVVKGKVFLLSCYNPGTATSDEVKNVFHAVNFSDINHEIEEYRTQKNWILPFIIVMCIVVAAAAFALLRKLYKNSSEN